MLKGERTAAVEGWCRNGAEFYSFHRKRSLSLREGGLFTPSVCAVAQPPPSKREAWLLPPLRDCSAPPSEREAREGGEGWKSEGVWGGVKKV